MKIHLIAAARPNFMKIAPLYHALKKEQWAEPLIVHTGQHYDLNMSDVFFNDLGLPEPDINLGVGSGTHAEQTGQVMMAYEKVLFEYRPHLVIVVGDVNSTMACTLAATKTNYQTKNPINLINTVNSLNSKRPVVAHLEAGLRSFDRTMPEEINRLVTDALADILWTPSADADENLIDEGVSKEKILRVGNIMIDSLEMMRDKIQGETTYPDYELGSGEYGVVTLHRPANVDDPEILKSLCKTLSRLSSQIPLIFPIHPRTRKNIDKIGSNGDLRQTSGLKLLEPLSYKRFMNLVFNCRLAITDSGGIQEETTFLGIPCLTLRPNTERPITINRGTNKLCTPENLEECVNKILCSPKPQPCKIEYWDGHTADRVVHSIKALYKV